MDPYNFWQDFFDTYQSLSDWIKALWLIVPPGFVLALVTLVMRFRIESKRADYGGTGKPIYSIHRDLRNQIHIIAHSQQIDDQPALLLIDPLNREPVD